MRLNCANDQSIDAACAMTAEGKRSGSQCGSSRDHIVDQQNTRPVDVGSRASENARGVRAPFDSRSTDLCRACPGPPKQARTHAGARRTSGGAGQPSRLVVAASVESLPVGGNRRDDVVVSAKWARAALENRRDGMPGGAVVSVLEAQEQRRDGRAPTVARPVVCQIPGTV